MTILVALLGLSALIIIHELGHMLAAKAVGVKVTEFALGFGPAFLKKKYGETTYSIRIILLGGFIRMAGMNFMGMDGGSDEEEGPKSYDSKPAWRRALIIFAGPLANLLAAVVIFAGVYMIGVQTGATTEIKDVIPGSLASEAGLRPGDEIVSVDGSPVYQWEDLQGIVGEKRPGEEVSVAVERDGEREEYAGTLRADPDDAQRAIIGISPVPVYTSYGPLEALGLGVKNTVQLIGLMGWLAGQLVTGEIDLYDSVSSPIGVVSVSSDVVSSLGAERFAELLALISIELAVINLLPLLPLDGGHLLFIAAEKVLGRRVSAEILTRMAAFGLALIMMLFVFATYADLSKISTGQPFITEQRP